MAPPLLVRRHDADHIGSNGGDGMGTDVRGLAVDSQKLAMAMTSDSQEARQAIRRLAPDYSTAVISIHETLLAVTGKLDVVKTRKEEMVALTKLCAFLTAASVIVVSRQQQLTDGGGGASGRGRSLSRSLSSSSSSSIFSINISIGSGGTSGIGSGSGSGKKAVRRFWNLDPLETCVQDLELLVEKLGKRRTPLLRRSNSMGKVISEIGGIHSRVADLAKDMGLAGVLAVFKGVLEDTGGEHGTYHRRRSGGGGGGDGGGDDSSSDGSEFLTEHEVNLARQPVRYARVPSLAPPRESWHVRRERVISTVLQSLLSTSPGVVGLVGGEGAGKSTTAAEIVRSPEVLEYFSDGVVWLPVNKGNGSKAELPSVMHRLAGMVHEEIVSRHDGGSAAAAAPVTDIRDSAEDSAAYIRGVVERGAELRDGKRRQLRCLVVADNVWEKEVVMKLRHTGLWVLLTSCKVEMINEVRGHPVVIGRLVEADAVRVLRRAAGLPSGEPSPVGGKNLAELCGRMALELSFVGRWSTVRGSKDPMAWQDAADTIRAELKKLELKEAEARGGGVTGNTDLASSSASNIKLELQKHEAERSWSTNDDEAHRLPMSRGVGGDVDVSTCALSPSSGGRAHDARRRKAVLSAGFRDLVDRTGGDNMLRGLYLALAVLPNGHEFTAKDAVVLLHERQHRPGAGGGGAEKGGIGGEEEQAAGKALKNLEARGMLVPAGGRMGGRGSGSSSNKASYRMHHAHASFARENLMEFRETLGWAVRRWVRYISSREAVLFFDPVVLVRLWLAVEDVGGTGWREGRPYEMALGEIDNGDPRCSAYLVAVAKFRSTAGDWDGASLMWRRLLAVEQQAQEPNVMYPLWKLVDAAEKNNRPQEAASWRQAGYEALNQAMSTSTPMSTFCTGADGSGRDRGYTPSGGSPNDPTDTAAVIRSLTLNMARFGPSKGTEAENMLRRALEIEVSRLGPDDTRVAATLQRLGICVRQAGRLREAEKLLRRALKIEEESLGEDDVQVARTAFHLAVCLRLAGRFQDAEVLLRRVTDVETAKRRGDDLYVARALHELGLCARLSNKGREQEAARMFARALAVREEMLGPEDPSVGQTLYELGICFRRERKLSEAEAFLRKAVEVKKASALSRAEERTDANVAANAAAATGIVNRITSGNSDSNDNDRSEVSVALAMFQLGVCILQSGQRLDEAEAILRSVLAIEEERLGPNHLSVARIACQLGTCLQWGGRSEEAESMLMGCVETLKAKLGADHDEVKMAKDMLDMCTPTE